MRYRAVIIILGLGLTSLLGGNFSLGQNEIVADQYEPDNQFLNASKIELGQTQDRSFHNENDLDFVYFILDQTTTIEIRTFVDGKADTMLTLYYDNYTVIASNDDFAGLDSKIIETLEAGVYVMLVESVSLGFLYNYQLKISLYVAISDQYEPNNNVSTAVSVAINSQTTNLELHTDDIDYFNFTLAEAKFLLVEVELSDDEVYINTVVKKGTMTISEFYGDPGAMNLTAGDYTIYFESNSIGSVFYNFSLVDFDGDDSYEPNDQRGSAASVSPNSQLDNLNLAVTYPTKDEDWFNISLTEENAAGKYLTIVSHVNSLISPNIEVYNGTSTSPLAGYSRLTYDTNGFFFPITTSTEYLIVKISSFTSILNYSLTISIQTQKELGFDDYETQEYGLDAFSTNPPSDISSISENRNITRSIGSFDETDHILFELPNLAQFNIHYSIDFLGATPSTVLTFDLLYLGTDNSSIDYKMAARTAYNVTESTLQGGGKAGFYRIYVTNYGPMVNYTLDLEILSFTNISTLVDVGDSYEPEVFGDAAPLAYNQNIERSLTRFSSDTDFIMYNMTEGPATTISFNLTDYELIDPKQTAEFRIQISSFTGALTDFQFTNFGTFNIPITETDGLINYTINLSENGQYLFTISSFNLQYLAYNASAGELVEQKDESVIIFTPPPETTSTSDTTTSSQTTSSSETLTSDTTSSQSSTSETTQDDQGNDSNTLMIITLVVLITALGGVAYLFRDKLLRT